MAYTVTTYKEYTSNAVPSFTFLPPIKDSSKTSSIAKPPPKLKQATKKPTI